MDKLLLGCADRLNRHLDTLASSWSELKACQTIWSPSSTILDMIHLMAFVTQSLSAVDIRVFFDELEESVCTPVYDT